MIEGGEEKSYDEIGCPEGTTFIIRNLFFNTPARRKFLKSKMTEAGYVESFIQRLALSHPDISFKFICDNKNKISTSGNGNLKDVIYNIFGRDVAMNLLPVKGNENGILVDGYIGKPVISRGNRNYENYFVNGRYLKNNIISKAIEEGYKGHAMVHKFPFTALMISMDPHCFDANVHPAKMEMRFRNAEELYSSVMSAVRSSFVKKELIPKVGIGNDKKGKESVKKIPEPFERKRRAIEERFSSLSQEKIREIEKRKEQGDAAEQRGSVLAKNSMENNVRDSVQGNDGNNAQNPIQNPAQNTTGNMSGSIGGYSGVHGENSENATEISNRRSSIEERIARLHVGENNAIKKEIDDVIPKSMDESTAKAEEYSESDDRQIKQDKKPSGQKELLKEADTYGKGTQMSFADVPLLSEEARPKHRIIGQVFRTYWLVEFDEKLFFVDQHAAHEKVYYERFVKRFREQTVESQYLSPPLIVSLNLQEEALLKANRKYFEDFGFEIEPFGGKEYCINAVPANLYGLTEEELFLEMLDNLASEKLSLIHISEPTRH